MKIYLIRHGKTLANEQRLYCGRTDLPLSELGRRELAGLHPVIQASDYVTSGALRTEQTLRLLCGDVPYRVDCRFREMDFGVFEMYSYQQLKDREDYQAWLAGDNTRNVPPGGESGAEMAARVLAAFRALGEDTAVFTHGGPIAAIMADQFPRENKNRYQWQPGPGHGYLLENGRYTPF